MTIARIGARPEEVRQSAQHVLFVEGSSPNTLDPQVLGTLLGDIGIRVEPLGACFHIQSVSEALGGYHPTYYFLVDRDHQDNAEVERSWKDFSSRQSQLIIWRRRELENYFIVPEYLSQSQYIKRSVEQLKQRILKEANKNIYFDAANMAIVSVREEMKAKWIVFFPSASELSTKDDALKRLKERLEFEKKKKETIHLLDMKSVSGLFERQLDRLFGGESELQYGKGLWLELMRGKPIFREIANSCFQVKNAKGESLQGDEKIVEVAKGLLRLPIERQPEDFQKLHALLRERVRPGAG